MYRITIEASYGEEVVHETACSNKEYLATSASLTKEVNKAGTLTFTVPYNNYAYSVGLLNQILGVVRVYRDGVLFWKGRIIDTQSDFFNNFTVNCEGWLSVLMDSIVEPIPAISTYSGDNQTGDFGDDSIHGAALDDFGDDSGGTGGAGDFGDDSGGTGGAGDFGDDSGGTGDDSSEPSDDNPEPYYKYITIDPDIYFTELINLHNSKMHYGTGTTIRYDKRLTPRVSGTSYGGPFGIQAPNYETTLDHFQQNVLNNDEIGGKIWISGESDIYYYPDGLEPINEQEIIFGVNLLDYSKHIDASKIYTCLMPVGKDNLTIDNKYLINSIAVNQYGYIYRTQQFSEIDNKTKLAEEAGKVLNKNIEEAITIDLSVFDLSLIDPNLTEIQVGSMTRVISTAHDIDTYYLCNRAEYDLCNPANNHFTLGESKDTFTDKHNKLLKETTLGKFESVPRKR